MTTEPDTRNYAREHFDQDVPPPNITFHPTCKVCGGRLIFNFHPDTRAFGYRHAPAEDPTP